MKTLKLIALFLLLCTLTAMAQGQVQEQTVIRTLQVSADDLSSEAVYLRLEDVDTFCDVSVNGHYVGSTANRFRRYEWDGTRATLEPYPKTGLSWRLGLGP